MVLRRRLGVLLFVLCAFAACKRKGTVETTKLPPPVDHLAPEEVVEGKENAFGLPLPRASTVQARFDNSVHVTSTLSLQELEKYVEERVKDGTRNKTDRVMHFKDVTALVDATHHLDIEVRRGRSAALVPSEMIITDVTPPPFDPTLSNEDRWKKVGLTPDGKLIDPKHLE